ncbi:MAG: DUF1178 family protein [Candidatus Protistobacter heckmanni]|nr:DUF1178 family protein [Candidatus Protistobacter heckmanni]
MKVYNLRCSLEHGFEGWFASAEDYESQLGRGLVECPVCGDKGVVKMPSAPRLNLSGSEPAPAQAVAADKGGERGADQLKAVQGALLKAVREMLSKSEDVGGKFAEEARKIHYREAPERAIHGQASREEAAALVDEGIEVMMLPGLPGAKNTLQ